jgi:hypothetical protein
MSASRQTTAWAGAATLALAALGWSSIPQLFELCNSGYISGPGFLVVVAALTTLAAGGLRLLFAARSRGELFIVSAVLFVMCALDRRDALIRTLPVMLAAIGPIAGIAFSFWKRRKASMKDFAH